MTREQESTFANRIAGIGATPRVSSAVPFGIIHKDPVVAPQTWFVIATLPLLMVSMMSDAPIPAGELTLRLALSLLLSLVLHQLFASIRHRPIDRGWLMHGWLYALMLPAGMNLSMTALGLSFGVVIGALIFGGSGRYLVSPALLGFLFLSMSYPDGFGEASSQSFLIDGEALSPSSASAAACVAGAVLLILVGVISSRVVIGGLIGAAALIFTFGLSSQTAVAPHWNWLLGVFPFCLAFLATDPTATTVTRPGRWCYGFLFGALAILLRVVKPDQPESAYAACLLTSMFAPLIDHVYLRWKLRRIGSNA